MENKLVEVKDTISWDMLREQGLNYLQDMTGHIWSDFNIHDPGVTVFETLCHGIADLDEKLTGNIEDILAHGASSGEERQFFSPAEMLAVNPVTVNDYRKLLIDIPGVKNGWIEKISGTDPDIYYDKDNNALLYDYAENSQRIRLNGLYRVFVEKDEEYIPEVEQVDEDYDALLEQKVLNTLNSHRNICEDFEEIHILEVEDINVYTDIQVADDMDFSDEQVEDLLSRIVFDLEDFISPKIPRYSLKKMLAKGKSMEEIFNGPQLVNGFIDDDDLGTGEKRRELHTSDLMRIMMSHQEVRDVRNVYIANAAYSGEEYRKEWALALDDTKASRLSVFSGERIRLFKGETLLTARSVSVIRKTQELKVIRQKENFDYSLMDVEEPLGVAVDLKNVTPLPYLFPSNYGISETGLSSDASDERKAQALQLRGYLIFFEQLLVNYLKQLESFAGVFSFRQDRETIFKTYFSEKLPDSVLRNDSEEDKKYEYNEGTDVFDRKNRILNHLLAQFNEKFTDFALFQLKQNEFLETKADFIENYPVLSRNRGRAINLISEATGDENIGGLKEMIAAKLGLNKPVTGTDGEMEVDHFHMVEHILLRPEGSLPLEFLCSEKITEDLQPDPYSYRLTYIIPKRKGRFINNKFREIAHSTLAASTPAHISHRILEFDPNQMDRFSETYEKFLQELKQSRTNNLDLYNPYRNELMEILGLGTARLPVLHLMAGNLDGTGEGELEDQDPVFEWKDLSRNDNHATNTSGADVIFVKDNKELPYLKFGGAAQMKIKSGIVEADFSIAAVFRIPGGNTSEELFPMLAGMEGDTTDLSLGFTPDGDVAASIHSTGVTIESVSGVTHMALMTGNSNTGEVNLYVDGTLQSSKVCSASEFTFSHDSFLIGSGVDNSECEIGEIVVLDSVVTASGRKKLEQYFSDQWKIALSAVASIEKPSLHLNAGTPSHVIRDSSGKQVVTWEDLGLENHSATQGISDLQPYYQEDSKLRLPVIMFNGGRLNMANPEDNNLFGEDFTLALVYRADSSGYLIDGSVTDAEQTVTGFYLSVTEEGTLNLNVGSKQLELSALAHEPHMAIISGRIDGEKLHLSIHQDGKSSVSETLTGVNEFKKVPTDLSIGCDRVGNNSFSGFMGEIISYRRELTVRERQRLEEYLSGKWLIDRSGVNEVVSPVLHLDASRLTSVLDADGAIVDGDTRVHRWVDLSSSGNDAKQVSKFRRPEFTLDGINQSGSISLTQVAISDDPDTEPTEDNSTEGIYEDSLNVERRIQDDFTLIAVFQAVGSKLPIVDRTAGWTKGAALLDADCSGPYNDFGLSLALYKEKLVVMGGIGDRLTKDHTIRSRELDVDKPHVVILSRLKSTGEVKLYVDGLEHAAADLRDDVVLNDSKSIKIGAFNSEGSSFCGLVGEIIMLDSVPIDSDRVKIEKYLSEKWRIPCTGLPVEGVQLSLHLDASSRESISLDSEGRVLEWRDTHDLTKAAVQDSTGKCPIYIPGSRTDNTALRFNNSFMTVDEELDSYENFTVAVVYRPLSAGNSIPDSEWEYGSGIVDNFVEGDTENSFGISMNRAGDLVARSGTDKITGRSGLNRPGIVLLTRSSASGEMVIYQDGIRSAQVTSSLPGESLEGENRLTIGAVNVPDASTQSKGYFHGDICEVAIFDDVLNTENRQRLETYLSRKWDVDITGTNSIAKPVLHLDASRIETITPGDGGTASEWIDLNGQDADAVQTDPTKMPVIIADGGNGLPILRFDRSSFILPRVFEDDFTVIAVFKADSTMETIRCMPVSKDAFQHIEGVDSVISNEIWNGLNPEYIDDQGNVNEYFTPGDDGFMDQFVKDLAPVDLAVIRDALDSAVISVLSDYQEKYKSIGEDAFATIGGINKSLSFEIRSLLITAGVINGDGKVASVPVNTGLNTLAESTVIHTLLTDNWFEGVGLIDGNCPGEVHEVDKRDFGLLISKDETDPTKGKLTAGFGVIDDEDLTCEATFLFDETSIGIVTRSKETGLVKLYSGNSQPVSGNYSQKISLEDSESYTIGAVNTGGNHFKGDIAEIIVLDTVPTESQIEEIQNYLSDKWGIS
ncbi:MAG: LamG domain-containing protein [Desulfobacterales bacterium]|nr:LamG domain-containing protein [Desulfobacterales bacterium]